MPVVYLLGLLTALGGRIKLLLPNTSFLRMTNPHAPSIRVHQTIFSHHRLGAMQRIMRPSSDRKRAGCKMIETEFSIFSEGSLKESNQAFTRLFCSCDSGLTGIGSLDKPEKVIDNT